MFLTSSVCSRKGRGGGGWHKASVSDCLPVAAPIGLSPLLILTLCGSERVLVVWGRRGSCTGFPRRVRSAICQCAFASFRIACFIPRAAPAHLTAPRKTKKPRFPQIGTIAPLITVCSVQCALPPVRWIFDFHCAVSGGQRDPGNQPNTGLPETPPTPGRRYRAYETTKDEDQPNPSWNAEGLTGYMARVFGFTKRETVAIMGAHALGKMHGTIALFKYDWQRWQTDLLNNNYFRMLAARPSKYLQCSASEPARVIGGPRGALADTGFYVRPLRKSVSGGPYQWFHYYRRCPDCYRDDQVRPRTTLRTPP